MGARIAIAVAIGGLAIVGAVVVRAGRDDARPAPQPAVPAASATTSSTAPPTDTTGDAADTGDSAPKPATPPTRVPPGPNAINVLVNYAHALPASWNPQALDVPDVRFIFDGFAERRQLRPPAARALERMFAAAARDGQPLAAVSGYRSYATQASLFNGYVQTKGYAEAVRVSAQPGYSEHETGLAMDVTGADGRCPAEQCFTGSPAAAWIGAHAVEFGFIVRYPEGREADTKYLYEPWHIRYLGTKLAAAVEASGQTYDDYAQERYFNFQPDP